MLIDDGSTDDSWRVIESLSAQNPHIKGLRFQRNYGKSAALNEGFGTFFGYTLNTPGAAAMERFFTNAGQFGKFIHSIFKK